jgi:hypothetical protein
MVYCVCVRLKRLVFCYVVCQLIGVEDPFIYVDSLGRFHALAHAFDPFFGVHAIAVAGPGTTNASGKSNWSTPMQWEITGAAYGNVVNFTDGSQIAYS